MNVRNTFHKIIKPFITACLVITFMLPASLAFMPRKADAAIPGTACISTFISMGVEALAEWLGAKTYSVPIGNAGGGISEKIQAGQSMSSYIKDCVEHGLALGIAKFLLAQMTDQIVQWINGGFHGEPFFVKNPGGFLKDIGDQVVGDMILGSDLGFLCSPFQNQIKLALTLSYASQYQADYSERSRCTLTDIVQNMEGFYENFTEGGWAGWFSLTQEPNNNAYGAFLEASSNLELKIGQNQSLKLAELNWGSGFLSQEECDDNGKNCQIVTPGKTIAGVLDKQLGVPADQLGVADDLDKIINALADQVFQQFLSGAKGLLGSSKSPQSPSDPNKQWLADIQAQADKEAADADAAKNTPVTTDVPDTSEQPPLSDKINMAVRALTESSSARAGHTSTAITDGDRINYFSGGDYTGFRSTHEANPWVMINLEKSVPIGKIQIYPRTDLDDFTVYQFHVSILDANKNEIWRETGNHNQDYRTTVSIPVPNINGQYVKVQLEDTGTLEMAEVEVYPFATSTPATNGQ